MTTVEFCQIEPIEPAVAQKWLAHILGQADAPIPLGKRALLLYHGDDGVTWGIWDGAQWLLGCSEFPEISPQPAAHLLQEIRIFSPDCEVLVWRTEIGLRGRVLRDVAAIDANSPLAPHVESRPLMFGKVLATARTFARVGTGTGAEQVLPQKFLGAGHWPRLCVRHYFETDQQTGAVRVAASRLMEVQ